MADVPIQRSRLPDACHNCNAAGAQKMDCCWVVLDGVLWQANCAVRALAPARPVCNCCKCALRHSSQLVAPQGAAQHPAAISRGGTQIEQNFECFCLQAGGTGGRAQRLLQWTHQQRQGARRAGAAPSGPAARPARSGCPSLFAGHHHHQFCGWLAIKQVCMPRVPRVTKGAKQVLAAHKRRSQLLTHKDTATDNDMHPLLSHVC